MANINDRMRLYSRHLYNILDHIGSSEYVRRTIQHGSTVQELLLSATQNISNLTEIVTYTYHFGSAIEGSTTPGLKSDLDCLICTEFPPVVECRPDSELIEYLLMITDEITPPGYTKLQKITNNQNRELWTIEVDEENVDLMGNPVLKNKTLVESMTNDEINGPAGTTLKNADYPGVPDIDYVPAFRCATWPSHASDWLTRPRPHGFPSQDMVDRFVKYGCFLVSVGHPMSQERHLQWRFSFSIQEREIMFGLSPVQFKCYVLLKMVKKNFVTNIIPNKSLTSYHCKTCIFYMLENLQPDQWQPENIIQCLKECLNVLLNWFKVGFIPNYFIPKENLWKGDEGSREMVVDILSSLMETTPDFLEDIQTDTIGVYLAHAVGECNAAYSKGIVTEQIPAADETQTIIKTYGVNRQINAVIEESDSSDFSEDGEDSEIVDSIVNALLNKGLDGAYMDSDDFDLEKAIQAELFAAVTATSGAHGESQPNITSDDIIEQFISNYVSVKAVADMDLSESTNGSPINTSNNQEAKSFMNVKVKRLIRNDSCQTDTVNTLLQNPALKEQLAVTRQELDKYIYKRHVWTLDHIVKCAKEILVFIADDHLERCISLHRIVLRRMMLESDKRLISEHVGLDRRMTAAYIIPFLKTSIGSQVAIQYLHAKSKTEREMLLEESTKLLTEGCESDAMSGKLKHAAVLFKTGRVEESKVILDSVDEVVKPNMLTACGCSTQKDYVNEHLRNKIGNDELSTSEILRGYVGVCVWFLQTEMLIIPNDLRYELYRSVFTQTRRLQNVDDWFDCVAVDPDVFLFYMLYRVNQALGNKKAMTASKIYMVMVMENNLNLTHLDTAYNLLGCLLKEDGELKAAWGCFRSSWFIRPDHNAAKWHMAIMVNEAIRSGNNKTECLCDADWDVETIYKRTANSN